MNRLGTCILLFLYGLCLMGCPVFIGAGAAVGTYHVVQGDLARLYRASYGRSWDAAVLTLEQMEMTIVKEDSEEIKGKMEGKIEAKRFDGSPVRLIFKQKALDVTELRVRIGAIGDRGKAELFHERFQENVFD